MKQVFRVLGLEEWRATSHLIKWALLYLHFFLKKFLFVREIDLELNKGREDLEWIMRAMNNGYKLTKENQIFIRKRSHENNTSILKLEDEAKIRLKLFRKNFSKK